MNITTSIRQGDVLLKPVAELPKDCTEVPLDRGRIVLAYGEVTGHAHAIADHMKVQSERTDHHDLSAVFQSTPRAEEIADATIARAKARLWQAPNGERFLEVTEPVHLTHEEHTAHAILPGIYQVPRQVEYTPQELRRVAD